MDVPPSLPITPPIANPPNKRSELSRSEAAADGQTIDYRLLPRSLLAIRNSHPCRTKAFSTYDARLKSGFFRNGSRLFRNSHRVAMEQNYLPFMSYTLPHQAPIRPLSTIEKAFVEDALCESSQLSRGGVYSFSWLPRSLAKRR